MLGTNVRLSPASGDFVTGMSHEFGARMSVILGIAERIEHSLPNDASVDCRALLRGLRRNSEVLLGLTSDVLLLSADESLEASEASRAVRLLDFLDEFAAKKRKESKSLSLVFELVIDDARGISAIVIADPSRIQRILSRLVDIGLTTSGASGVRLRVAIAGPNDSSTPDRPSLRFDLLTIGHAPIARVLRRSTKAAKGRDTRDISSSTDLGHGFLLMIYRKFSEQLAGTLEFDERPLEGRVFTLGIPAVVSEGIETASLEAPTAFSRSHPEPRYSPTNLKARILLAEDHRDNQKVIALRLNIMGADVTTVPYGLEAVNAALRAREKGAPFDLVVMDMQMPVLDGYGAAKELRDKGFDNLPIIALTAHSLPEDRDECLRFGCDDYVTKPISWSSLYQTVADQLNRASKANFSMRG